MRCTLIWAVLLAIGPSVPFRRGDSNADGSLDITDSLSTLGYLFLASPGLLPCDAAADSNDDGELDLSDAIYLLQFLFLEASPPPEPFCHCEVDPTPDGLSCASFEPCRDSPVPTFRRAWVAAYNRQIPDAGRGTAVTVDGEGNVYVHGYSQGDLEGFVTVKYDASGTRIWSALSEVKYGSLALDEAGDVYLAGSLSGRHSREDYATVKYDRDGTRLWLATYNGPSNLGDFAAALAVDRMGNAYVTGTSQSVGAPGFATVKYRPDGEELWVAHYHESDRFGSEATAIAVDGDGNACVTGLSRRGFTTLKYGPDGRERWVSFAAQSNSASRPSAAIDGQGNVYVSGVVLDDASNTDYLTLKYDPGGIQLWSVRYDRQGITYDFRVALAVDGPGNAYLAGTGSDLNYLTIKYGPNGKQLWEAAYGGPPGGGSSARAVAVDRLGNVYVTGDSSGVGTEDCATVAYDAAGNQLWAARYAGPAGGEALAADGAGNVHVTGSTWASPTNSNVLTLKYGRDGAQLWADSYDRPAALGTADTPTGLAVDEAGNVYLTGKSSGLDQLYSTVKYSPDGRQAWVNVLGAPGVIPYPGLAHGAMAAGKDGNLYISGWYPLSSFGGEHSTLKLDAEGKVVWSLSFPWYNPADEPIPTSIGLDALGNLLVNTSYGLSASRTAKYDPAGNELWVALDSEVRATALAMDPGGDVLITGVWGFGPDSRFGTIKYDSQGRELWAAQYHGRDSLYDQPKAIAVDVAGNVYITGNSECCFETVKYSPQGDELWAARYPGSPWGSGVSAIAVDGHGSVYVGGFSARTGEGYEYTTVKYDSMGRELWVAREGGEAGTGYDRVNAMALDSAGNVYVTGTALGNGTGYDFLTVEYDSGGKVIWIACYDGPGHGDDEATSLTLDGKRNLYVTGSAVGVGRNKDYATLKYERVGE